MRPRRERAGAALAGAAGAALVLLAGGRQWAAVRAHGALTPVEQTLTGGELAGAVTALGWAGLAALAALLATGGWARRAVGALLVLLGAAAAWSAAGAVRHAHVLAVAEERSALLRLSGEAAIDVSRWWAVAAAGGALLAVTGALAVARGHRWPGLSARYERPGAVPASARPARPAPAADDPVGLWKSLDRGEDPTADDG